MPAISCSFSTNSANSDGLPPLDQACVGLLQKGNLFHLLSLSRCSFGHYLQSLWAKVIRRLSDGSGDLQSLQSRAGAGLIDFGTLSLPPLDLQLFPVLLIGRSHTF